VKGEKRMLRSTLRLVRYTLAALTTVAFGLIEN
jgi:hypothetical protein